MCVDYIYIYINKQDNFFVGPGLGTWQVAPIIFRMAHFSLWIRCCPTYFCEIWPRARVFICKSSSHPFPPIFPRYLASIWLYFFYLPTRTPSCKLINYPIQLCVYKYKYIQLHTYIHTSIHPCMHAYIHTYTHTYIHTNKYIHTNTYIQIHTYKYIHTNTYIQIHTYKYIHTHTYITLHYITLHYITYITYIQKHGNDIHTYITLHYNT